MVEGWIGWLIDHPEVTWSGAGITGVAALAALVRRLWPRRKPEVPALVQPVPTNTVTSSTGTLQSVTAGGNVTVHVGMTVDQAKELAGAFIDTAMRERIDAATEDERRRAAEAEARARASEEQLAHAIQALDALRAQLPAQSPGIDSALAALGQGDTAEAEDLFTKVLADRESAGRDQFREAAAAARHLGALAFLHDTRKALGAYRKAVELDPENPDGWNELGHLMRRVGELGEAERSYERMVTLGEQVGDKVAIAKATGNLGLIHELRGDLDRAEASQRRSLALNEELGRKEGMACVYGNLGLIHWRRGNLDSAEAFHTKSLALNEELGQKEGTASEYGNLGIIHLTRGDLDRAEDFHRKSLALEEELGRKEGMANQYGNLGVIQDSRGDLDRAEEFYRLSLALNEELGRKDGMAIQHNNLGAVFEQHCDQVTAAEHYCKALTLFRQVGMAREIATVEQNLKRVGAEVPPP